MWVSVKAGHLGGHTKLCSSYNGKTTVHWHILFFYWFVIFVIISIINDISGFVGHRFCSFIKVNNDFVSFSLLRSVCNNLIRFREKENLTIVWVNLVSWSIFVQKFRHLLFYLYPKRALIKFYGYFAPGTFFRISFQKSRNSFSVTVPPAVSRR